MNAFEKQKLFEKLQMDAHWLDVMVGNFKGDPITPEKSSTLNELARKVAASALALDQAMHGIEPSKVG